MFRIFHGETFPLEPEKASTAERDNMTEGCGALPVSASPSWPFGYLFRDLQFDPLNLLPAGEETLSNLRELGNTMHDDNTSAGVPVPTIYTFFGQFVDHDITLESASGPITSSNAGIEQMTLEQVESLIVNYRSPNLELDSVYSPVVPRDPANNSKLKLGEVSEPGGLPPGKSIYNDLPRLPRSPDYRCDRVAQIGDTRNDENLITSQLHVAFLHAHNALIDRGYSFEQARKLIIQHYQWIVLYDFLERVADPAFVKRIRYEGPKFFTPAPGSLFMPLEFSVAAYRFGHSKVRQSYFHYNNSQLNAPLAFLFTFTRFSGYLANFDTLPGNWVIDWTHFLKLDDINGFPRPIDTTLVPELLQLRQQAGRPIGEGNLATRNLLRGYVLRMPTGQAVATAMKAQGIMPLTEDQILSVAANDDQRRVLKDSSFLTTRTPLWFYILAEAAYYSRGYHLGPVGSTIVAEVLVGVLRQSDYSILSNPYWTPTLGLTPNKFDLADFLRLAGVF